MTGKHWDCDELAIDNADSWDELTAQLYLIRKRRGLSQKDVARAMGTSKSAVSRMEAGHGNPTIRTLMQYAEAVGAYLSLGAVPVHNAAEWKAQSRRITEELQGSSFVETLEGRESVPHGRLSKKVATTTWSPAGAGV